MEFNTRKAAADLGRFHPFLVKLENLIEVTFQIWSRSTSSRYMGIHLNVDGTTPIVQAPLKPFRIISGKQFDVSDAFICRLVALLLVFNRTVIRRVADVINRFHFFRTVVRGRDLSCANLDALLVSKIYTLNLLGSDHRFPSLVRFVVINYSLES